MKRVIKIGFSNYQGLSLLSETYKAVCCSLLSRLTSCIDEIIGDNECGL
jgi:hypothetical protein